MLQVYEHIKQDLTFNLNNWKRLEGDDSQLALEHFYEKVFSKDRLKECSTIEGVTFPPWGMECKGKGKYPVEIYGGYHSGKWVSVGLRWRRDIQEYKKKKSQGTHNNRTKAGMYYKPQVVVAFEDPHLYDYFWHTRNDNGTFKYKKLAGGKGEEPTYHFNKSVSTHPLFETAKIIPIAFVIKALEPKTVPLDGNHPDLAPNETGALADGLVMNKLNMYKDNIEGEQFREKMEADKQNLDRLEQLGRQAIDLWRLND